MNDIATVQKNQGKTSHIFKIYFNFVASVEVLTKHIRI